MDKQKRSTRKRTARPSSSRTLKVKKLTALVNPTTTTTGDTSDPQWSDLWGTPEYHLRCDDEPPQYLHKKIKDFDSDDWVRSRKKVKQENSKFQFICQVDDCGRSYASSSKFLRHVNSTGVGHANSDLVKIPNDPKTKLSEFQTHCLEIDGKFQCVHCKEEGFTRKSGFYYHMRSFHGTHFDSSFLCEFCKKRFVKLSKLTTHVNIVHKSLQTKCVHQGCTVMLKSNSKAIHEKMCHPKPEDLSYECDMCPEKFSYPYLIQPHKNRVHGEKDYKCTVCTFTTGWQENLIAHLHWHLSVSIKLVFCRPCNFQMRRSERCQHEKLPSHKTNAMTYYKLFGTIEKFPFPKPITSATYTDSVVLIPWNNPTDKIIKCKAPNCVLCHGQSGVSNGQAWLQPYAEIQYKDKRIIVDPNMVTNCTTTKGGNYIWYFRHRTLINPKTQKPWEKFYCGMITLGHKYRTATRMRNVERGQMMKVFNEFRQSLWDGCLIPIYSQLEDKVDVLEAALCEYMCINNFYCLKTNEVGLNTAKGSCEHLKFMGEIVGAMSVSNDEEQELDDDDDDDDDEDEIDLEELQNLLDVYYNNICTIEDEEDKDEED